MTNLFTILLFWQFNTTDVAVNNYRIYPRITSDNAIISYVLPNGGYIDVGNTNAIRVLSYPKHIQYFVVKCVNIWGEESDASNMIYVIEERQ